MINTIGVVGAGTMGSGIAQVFAQAGFTVMLVESRSRCSIARAARIEKSLAKFVEKGTLRRGDATRRSARLHDRDRRSTRSATADYVVEAIVEDAEAKRALFTSLDALAKPDAILASNTSSISITRARRRHEAARTGCSACTS